MANSFYEHSGYPPGSRARNSSQKLRAEFSAIEAGAQAIETALALKADAADVSEVDNTSDADKPISTLTQAALDLKADYSALVDFDPATPGADKMLVTNATGDGWEYPSITAAGKALLDDADAAAQRATLGFPNDALTRSRKNLLINGGFDVWQRGTSFADSLNMYTADRWLKVVTSSTFLVDYAYIHGQEEGLTRCIKLQPFACQDAILLQRVEGLQRFSNKTVTLSFWAKSDDPEHMSVEFVANFGTGGTPSTIIQAIGVTKVATTASWVKYSVTAELPSMLSSIFGTNNDSHLDVNFWYSASSVSNLRTDTLGQQIGVFYLSNVQLEFGDTATDFEYRHPAEELMLCQRYYETGSDGIPKVANMLGTTILRVNAIPFKVTKRVAPVMTIGALTPSGHDGTPGAINATYPSADEFCVQWDWTGGTAGRAVSAQFTWIADAEL